MDQSAEGIASKAKHGPKTIRLGSSHELKEWTNRVNSLWLVFIATSHNPISCDPIYDLINICKQTVSLCRKEQRNSTSQIELRCERPNSSDFEYIASVAYYMLGVAYEILRLISKAKACFTLSSKVYEQSVRSFSPDSSTFIHGDVSANIGPDVPDSQIIAFAVDGKLLTRNVSSLAKSKLGPLLTVIESADNDVEDYVSKHSLLNSTDSIRFNCTQCGECCRTSDNILLTPLDMFNISRSSNMMKIFGINNTVKLISHIRFKQAFHFVLKEGRVPICYLRPVKSATGRCSFSHELFRQISCVCDCAVPEGCSCSKSSTELFDAFDSLTFTENGGSQRAERVVNSFGSSALGCILGLSSMPTMCASYPLAPELSIADFWHVRRAFWHNKRAPETEGGRPIANKLSTAWQLEERFVTVNVSSCEGFELDSSASACVSKSTTKQSRSVRDFLVDEKTDLSNKLEHMQWFLSIVEEVSSFIQVQIPKLDAYPTVAKKLISVLAKIWFNFDALTKSSRPIKSVSRLVRDIETLTWSVMHATRAYIDKMASESFVDQSVAERNYESLLCCLLDDHAIDQPNEIDSSEGVDNCQQELLS